MADDTRDWIHRIRSVEHEYQAARLAAERLLVDAAHDPPILVGQLKLRDVRRMADQLEGTYFVRLFSEFETALRLFWPTVRNTDPPRSRDLIDGIAATRRVTNAARDRAHRVREYRNALVHERAELVEVVPLSDARSHLCTFLSFLPPSW